jgi:hypothetical protein
LARRRLRDKIARQSGCLADGASREKVVSRCPAIVEGGMMTAASDDEEEETWQP